MLATVGIGAMVAFVFLDPVMRYMGRSRAQENPVVVETRYGALTQNELGGLMQSREVVKLFLHQLSQATAEAHIKKGELDVRNAGQAVDQHFGFWHPFLMGRSKPGPEESAIETLVLAKRAEQQGLVVNDRSINDLLKQITADNLSSQAIHDIIGNLRTVRKLSVARLFDALRIEMLASKYSQLFQQSLVDIPPAQRFEYYSRLNRRAKAEVMPLSVADFANQVKDPSPEELQGFYESHKNSYPDPSSPEPGFKQPKRAAFQYFKADFAKFQDQFKAQVTEEEIQEYYEKNKAQFRVMDLPADKDAEKSEQAAADGADESKPEDPAQAESDKPAEPDGGKPADDKPTEPEKPAPEKPAPEKPAEPKSPQTRLGAPRATIRLVSTETSEEKSESKPAAKAEASTDAPAADEAAPAEAEKAEGETAKPPAAEGEAAATDAEEKPAKKPPEAQFEPLEKVRDTIRDSIAGQKASSKITEIVDELSAAMRRYADDMDRYNAGKGANPKLSPPKPFPFAELAQSKGVEAKELPLATAAETAKEDIGQVRRIIADPRSRFGFRSEMLDEFAFSDSLPTYKATTGQDNEGNEYLFWKTEEEAAYVPRLDQIRDQVVKAWKLIHARALARRRADEYAAQAREAGKPLNDVFAAQSNLKVTETGAFSWLSVGNVPFDPSGMQPRISPVAGVEHPGAEFMEAVFKLSPGEIGVALNEPQDTAYVVRLTEYERLGHPPRSVAQVAAAVERRIAVADFFVPARSGTPRR